MEGRKEYTVLGSYHDIVYTYKLRYNSADTANGDVELINSNIG